ncbi:MAG: hypothetical protein ACLRIS_00120 [Flavonifractor plautii]
MCAPIRFTNLRRNEVKSTLRPLGPDGDGAGQGRVVSVHIDDIQQRAALLLRDVRYVIEAHLT